MEVVQYKCPNCGANLEFDIVTQRFCCKYCFSSFSRAEMEKLFQYNEEHPLDVQEPAPEPVNTDGAQADDFGNANNLYQCPNCGAGIITDENTSATQCYYCHSPVMLTGRLAGDYRPKYVIPFKKTHEEAQAIFREWCGKKFLVPKEFKSIKNAEKIEGIYIPYWLADCRLGFSLDIKAVDIKSRRSGDYIIKNCKEFDVKRSGTMFFMGVPADASSKAADLLMQNIEPYDYNEMTEFSMSYLSGHLAEKYDVDKDMVRPEIERRIREACKEEMLKTVVGYESKIVENESYDMTKMGWQYVLLPVWFLSYRFKDKDYHFAMNGQTGKFAGNLPIRIGLLRGICIGSLLAMILIIFLLGGVMGLS